MGIGDGVRKICFRDYFRMKVVGLVCGFGLVSLV